MAQRQGITFCPDCGWLAVGGQFGMGQDGDLGKEKYHLNWVLKAEKLSQKLTRQVECISS